MSILRVKGSAKWEDSRPATQRCKACGQHLDSLQLLDHEGGSRILVVVGTPMGNECDAHRFFPPSNTSCSAFRELFLRTVGTDLDECHISPIVACSVDKLLKSVRTACSARFDAVLARPWRVIVCVGTESLKHAFMRGASTPSLETLIGNPVVSREHKSKIVVLPDPWMLKEVEDTRYFAEPARELKLKEEQMVKAMNAVKEVLNG